MNNVRQLVAEFTSAFDDKDAQAAVRHAEKVEATYKAADEFLENTIEPQLLDDDSDVEVDNISDISDENT